MLILCYVSLCLAFLYKVYLHQYHAYQLRNEVTYFSGVGGEILIQ